VVAAVILDRGRFLTVSKKSAEHVFYLPGGKPEPREQAQVTLGRELEEELGVGVADARLLGVVEDIAALERVPMRMTVFLATIIGVPQACAEIAKLRWTNGRDDTLGLLAPAVRRHVVPQLLREGLLAS
jgi:ADP-ribose pyrophosphatase YjhB (NUDIX family)